MSPVMLTHVGALIDEFGIDVARGAKEHLGYPWTWMHKYCEVNRVRQFLRKEKRRDG